MKKITSIFISVLLIIAMAVPAFAEGYRESITAKPAPGIVGDKGVIGYVIDEDGNVVRDITEGELIITALADADTLPEDARKELLDVYNKIAGGTMEYPDALKDLLGDIVAKDLFDVTAVGEDLIRYIAEGHSIQFTLDAKIGADALAAVAAFVDGQWIMATECINNGDGTITVVLPKICPVGIFVKGEAAPQPGEPVGSDAEEGDCTICHTFFPYLGAAPVFDGICIICFLLIIIAICVVVYIVRKATKKDKKETDNK